MKDSEAKKILETVMDRMVQAGWLRRYTYTEGKGFYLDWHPDAVVRVGTLRKIATTYQLADSETMVVSFSKVAQGASLPDAGLAGARPSQMVLTFWREAIEALGIFEDGDLLLGLVHVLHGWAPDLEDYMRDVRKDRGN